jgi:hypothetical protein
MEQMRTVYVGFSKHRHAWAVMSFLIRWWENPKTWNPLTWFSLFSASHVFLIFPANSRRPFYMVSEAAGSSVRYMSQQNFEGHASITRVYQMRFAKPTYDKIKTYSEQYAGTPYALFENIGIVISRILGRSTNIFAGGEDRQKCSELVLRNAILRLPDMTFEKLIDSVKEECGYTLIPDLDSIGVRDVEVILDSLVRRGIIKEVSRYGQLKVK